MTDRHHEVSVEANEACLHGVTNCTRKMKSINLL